VEAKNHGGVHSGNEKGRKEIEPRRTQILTKKTGFNFTLENGDGNTNKEREMLDLDVYVYIYICIYIYIYSTYTYIHTYYVQNISLLNVQIPQMFGSLD